MTSFVDGVFKFASEPIPIHIKNDIYKKANDHKDLTYDRRVIRSADVSGNQKNARQKIKNVPDPIVLQQRRELRMKAALEHKRAKSQKKPTRSEAVAGRMHCFVQTELYLEELVDRVENADKIIQTASFFYRPATPTWTPASSGIDIATQIGDGDLFYFEKEVQPILEVLVKKTVELSLLEVMEEEELTNIRLQQRALEELRNADLAEMQRMQEKDNRYRQEKESALIFHRDRLALEMATKEKIGASIHANIYLVDLVPSAFGRLSTYGYLYNPIERDIELNFMSTLQGRVNTRLQKTETASLILDGIIRNIVSNRKSNYAELERTQAEWKMVDNLIIDIHDTCSKAAVDDLTDLMLHISKLASEGAQMLVRQICEECLLKAIDAFALEEAAALASAVAAEDAEEVE